jgi:hypothetical protein
MQHTRKALLVLMVLGAVVLASVGSYRSAVASPARPSMETSTSPSSGPSGHHDPGTTGEPDSGSTRNQKAPTGDGPHGRAGDAWLPAKALDAFRVTGWVWLMRQFGMGN